MNTIESILADFLTPEEAASQLRVCKRTLDRWESLREGPPITKLGRRRFYNRQSLQIWIRSRERARAITS
jgi:DNA-binding transcriptional MerR regulator